MITGDLQKRIHFGDRDAFLAVYETYGHEVYDAARGALGSSSLARTAVRQTFLSLFDEMLSATEDIDIPARVTVLADREIALLRLLRGGAPASSISGKDVFTPDLPPLEREHSFRRPARALFIKKRTPQRTGRHKHGALGRLLILLLVLVLLWALAGMLMNLGYLPALDFGYGWFDRAVYPLFTLG